MDKALIAPTTAAASLTQKEGSKSEPIIERIQSIEEYDINTDIPEEEVRNK